MNRTFLDETFKNENLLKETEYKLKNEDTIERNV